MSESANTVTVSPKYQIVIPREVRERAGLRPGDKLRLFYMNGSIEIVPLRSIKELQAKVKGVSGEFVREEDDRY